MRGTFRRMANEGRYRDIRDVPRIPAPRYFEEPDDEDPDPEEGHPMASPGFGKRSAPGQEPPSVRDFAHLRKREATIARYIDELPDGAAISIEALAGQLEDYGPMAVGTALKRLVAAGYLYRRRGAAKTPTGRTFLVTESYFSRTARSEEWWQEAVASQPATVPVDPWGRW